MADAIRRALSGLKSPVRGNTLSKVASAAAAAGEGFTKEKDRQEKKALDRAMQALRERQVAQGDEQLAQGAEQIEISRRNAEVAASNAEVNAETARWRREQAEAEVLRLERDRNEAIRSARAVFRETFGTEAPEDLTTPEAILTRVRQREADLDRRATAANRTQAERDTRANLLVAQGREIEGALEAARDEYDGIQKQLLDISNQAAFRSNPQMQLDLLSQQEAVRDRILGLRAQQDGILNARKQLAEEQGLQIVGAGSDIPAPDPSTLQWGQLTPADQEAARSHIQMLQEFSPDEVEANAQGWMEKGYPLEEIIGPPQVEQPADPRQLGGIMGGALQPGGAPDVSGMAPRPPKPDLGALRRAVDGGATLNIARSLMSQGVPKSAILTAAPPQHRAALVEQLPDRLN